MGESDGLLMFGQHGLFMPQAQSLFPEWKWAFDPSVASSLTLDGSAIASMANLGTGPGADVLSQATSALQPALVSGEASYNGTDDLFDANWLAGLFNGTKAKGKLQFTATDVLANRVVLSTYPASGSGFLYIMHTLTNGRVRFTLRDTTNATIDQRDVGKTGLNAIGWVGGEAVDVDFVMENDLLQVWSDGVQIVTNAQFRLATGARKPTFAVGAIGAIKSGAGGPSSRFYGQTRQVMFQDTF